MKNPSINKKIILDLNIVEPLQEIIKQACEGRLTVSHLQSLAAHRNSFKDTDKNIFSVLVNYSKPIEKMIAAGPYTNWNKYILNSRNFPASKEKGVVKLDIELISFGIYGLSSEEVLKRLNLMGSLRLADLWEVIALCNQYPKLISSSRSIAEFGTYYPGSEYVVRDLFRIESSFGNDKSIITTPFGCQHAGWKDKDCFAVVISK